MKKMKRGTIQSIQFLFLTILSIAIASAATLSPEEQTGITIPVDNDSPIIEINSPQNTTYNNLSQILINFTITDLTLNTIWYSLNHEQNITISQPFYLNFSEKAYTLTIYANDSLNKISSEEVSFLVNNSVTPCGDAICSSQESCSSCLQDCGSCQQPPSEGGGGSSGGGGGGGGSALPPSSTGEDTEIPEQERNQTQLGGETTSEDELGSRETDKSERPSIFPTTIFIIIILIIISSIIILIIFYKKRKNKKNSKDSKPHVLSPRASLAYKTNVKK